MPTTEKTTPTRRRKQLRQVPKGRLYIQASFNNTIISLTDHLGAVLAWSSAGAAGFKGARRSTPYAATVTAQRLVEKARQFGMHDMAITVSGVGTGRDSALRAIASAGFTVSAVKDVTPIPHNGCRPKKARRV